MRHTRRQAGFTLVEMIITIVIIGILASVGARMIVQPTLAFTETARRAQLVNAAAVALVQMSRDIRAALPNSVRVTGAALELLATVDGESYRSELPGAADDRLSFTGPPDSAFNTFGQLGSGGSYSGMRLAVYPLQQAGANPYSDPVMTSAGIISGVAPTPAPAAPQVDGEYRVSLGTPWQFPFDSPSHRIFLVRGPVSYICAGGQLTRYSGYAVLATQPASGAATGVGGAMVADQVESCSFSYVAVSARRGLATLAIVLVSTGERVRLLRQVHVNNTP